ncbi:MAG: hypothetical protein ACO3XO_05240 [Bdellovibrionota bacterium]
MKQSEIMDVVTKVMSDEPRIEGIRFVIDRSTKASQLSEDEIRAIGLTLFLQESTPSDSLWGKYSRIESLGRNE